MRAFVLQSEMQLFGGKRPHHRLRYDQAWMEDAGEGQERRGLLDNYSLRGFAGQKSFAARFLPRAFEAQGSGKGAGDSREGVKAAHGTQESQRQTNPSDALGRSLRFEPEIAGQTEGKHHPNRQRAWKYSDRE